MGTLRSRAPAVRMGMIRHPFREANAPDHSQMALQADPRFSRRNAFFVLRATVKQDGVLALYRGFLPPLIGGSCFCSAVFGAFSSTFSACEGSVFMDPVGSTGYRPTVFLASVSAAAARTAIETPFELVKTKMQLGITVFPDAPLFGQHTALSLLQQSYRGVTVTFLRNTLLLGTMFSVLDWTTRAAPDIVGAPVIGAICCGVSLLPTLSPMVPCLRHFPAAPTCAAS